jgi:hypothetical protein
MINFQNTFQMLFIFSITSLKKFEVQKIKKIHYKLNFHPRWAFQIKLVKLFAKSGTGDHLQKNYA